MGKLNIDYDLKHRIDRFITHYAQNWMADYDADEVGEYLVENRGYWGLDNPATRSSFLRWRYERKYPLERRRKPSPQSKTEEKT